MDILLVTKDPDCERLVRKLLRNAAYDGFGIHRADSVEDALRHLDRIGSQPILVDLGDAPAEGLRALEDLRRYDPSLPLLALTPGSDPATDLEAIRKGAHDVFPRSQLGGDLLPRALRFALERSILHRELQERDRDYRIIVETADEGIWTVDADNRTVFVNPRMASLMGYPAGEMVGRPALDFADAEGREIAGSKLARVREGAREAFEFRLRRKDGTPLWTRVVSTPLLDERGRYRGAFAMVTDISESKKQQDAVARLAKLVESSADAIISLDLEGRIVSWNPAAAKLYGYPVEEAIGQPMRMTVPPERYGEFDGILARLRNGETIAPYETIRRAKDGSVLTLSVSLSPIHDGTGRKVGTGAVIRDMSQQKKLEAQFHQAQKMEAVGRLAGGVAHDFNNLLTVICGYSSMLLARPAASEAGRQELEEIYRAGERATALTRQLLAFSRKQILQPQVVDLNAVVKDLEKMLRRLIGEDIDLTTTLQPDLGKVKVDVGQLEQVIMNLSVNARDAMPQGGRLMIESRQVEIEEGAIGARPDLRPGSYVTLSVSDTGIGMDKKILSHLFEPFFTTKGQGKGTGLGLSTIYGIVKQSGGHISVYSEPGRGSCFRVYLPLERDGAPAVAPVKTPVLSLTGRESILVVEDNELVRKLSCELLRQAGYGVRSAGTAAEAMLQCSREGFPELLLTDMVLPGMDGLTLCRKVAVEQPAVRTMLMTGYTEEAILHQGVGSSGIPLLHKPFSPRALLTAVRRVFESPKWQPALLQPKS